MQLIAAGADPKGRDGNGFTPLHAAAHAGHADIVSLLIDNGVDVNDQNNMANVTPLHMAAERGFVTIAKILLDNGATPDERAGRGHTPVAMATLNTHPEMVKLLRDHGADCHYFKFPKYRDYCLKAGS
jgi:ankyrin repeat protein